MKSKSLTYFLVIGVMCVWGIVFYRIYNSVAKEEVETISFKNSKIINPVSEVEDSFILNASYRDPFLGSVVKADQVAGKKKFSPPKAKAPEIPIDWSFITYNGTVYNKDAKKKVTLVTLHGQSFMLNEADKADEITLLKNFGDSIKVSYQGKLKYIKLAMRQ